MSIQKLLQKKILKENYDKGEYYISSGRKNNYYTLRYKFYETIVVGGGLEKVLRDYYVTKLSIDKDKAIEKAKQIIGKDLSTDIEVNPIGERNRNIDWSILQAGRYKGQSIFELMKDESGKSYLMWLMDNMSYSQKYAKTIELVKSLFSHDVEQHQTTKKNKEEEIKEIVDNIKKILQPYIDPMRDGGRGFRDSIAEDLEKGIVPSGRGLSITIDILAKVISHSRSGSKKYLESYEKILNDFNKAKELENKIYNYGK